MNVCLLPIDCDASARALQERIESLDGRAGRGGRERHLRAPLREWVSSTWPSVSRACRPCSTTGTPRRLRDAPAGNRRRHRGRARGRCRAADGQDKAGSGGHRRAGWTSPRWPPARVRSWCDLRSWTSSGEGGAALGWDRGRSACDRGWRPSCRPTTSRSSPTPATTRSSGSSGQPRRRCDPVPARRRVQRRDRIRRPKRHVSRAVDARAARRADRGSSSATGISACICSGRRCCAGACA